MIVSVNRCYKDKMVRTSGRRCFRHQASRIFSRRRRVIYPAVEMHSAFTDEGAATSMRSLGIPKTSSTSIASSVAAVDAIHSLVIMNVVDNSRT